MNKATRHITKTTSIITILVGVLVLAGWFFNMPLLKSVLPGIVEMKFNTAFCFILSGIALYLLDEPALLGPKKSLALICSWLVLMAGLLNLCQYIFGCNLGIDELLWTEGPGTIATSSPGRMSLSTSIDFTLLGIVFLLLRSKKYHLLIQVVFVFIITGSLLVALNHIFGTSFLNSFPQLANTALPTALLFMVLSIGVFYSEPLHYLTFSFQKKIVGFFVLTALVLVFTFFAIHKNQEYQMNTNNRVLHTKDVLLLNQEVLEKANDIETGTRGFVISGKEIFLEPFNKAEPVIHYTVQQLKELTIDNPRQQPRIDSLDKLVSSNIDIKKQLIALRKTKGFEAANVLFETGITKKLMDQLRSVLADIEREENQLLDKHKTNHLQNISNSSRVIITFQVIAGLLMLFVFVVIYNNTRARNKAEDELQKFKHFFNNSNDFSCIANVQGYFEILNPNFEKILGYSEKELRENQFLNFIHPDDIAATLQEVEKLKTGALTINFVNRYRKKNGDYLWLDWNTTPNPVTGKLYAIARDVTERKILEDKLKQFNLELEKQVEEKTREVIEKEKQYRFLLENMREGIQVIGFDWRYLFVNNAVVEQGKYSNEELLGHTMMEKYPGIENTELFKVLQQCMKERTAKVFENEFSFPDGTKEWFELSIQPVPEGIFILSIDITERKKAEQAITASEETRRLIMDSAQDAIVCIDSNSLVTVWTPQAEKVFGWKEGAAMGKKLADMVIPQQYRDMHNKGMQHYLHTGEGPILNKLIEITAVNKQGAEFPIELSIVPFYQKGKTFFCGFIRDITQRKKAEDSILKLNKTLEKRAAELLASNTELERFAYIASHDLQEPLRMVSSFLNLLAKELEGKLDATSTQYFDFALDGSQRMKQLIQDLLRFSRVGASKEAFKEINCNEMLSSLQVIFQESLNETGGSLRINPLPVVRGFPSQLQQVFQNLIANAIKYHDSNPPEIEVGCDEKKEFWQFYVKDNGIGIDPKFFDKIFIIFQRLHTRTAYSGTGIGLAVCKKIVEKHGGRIWAESKPVKARPPALSDHSGGDDPVGRGSTFYFTIPKNNV